MYRHCWLFSLFLLPFLLHSQDAWLADPLESLYPDENRIRLHHRYAADFPANGYAEVILLVKSSPGEAVSVEAQLNGEPIPQQYWFRLEPVPVEQNTGLDSRTEQFIGKVNPYVVRRAPFEIFEVIRPVSNEAHSGNDPYQAFLLQIPCTFFPGPGKYVMPIHVRGDGFSRKASFVARIHEAVIPELSGSRFFYTNWFNVKNMEKWHNVEPWTESWFDMLDKYARLMAHGRQNCTIIPGNLITWSDAGFSLDEEKMISFINVFRKHGFRYFESPHLLYRGDGDDWSSPELVVRLSKNGYFSEEGKKDIASIMQQIRGFTEKHQLTHQWLQHIADEPTSANADCFSAVVRQVKDIYPEIRIMEATNDRDGLTGAIDLWCPLINDFQENKGFFREREKAGEQVLVYTCLIPGGKWLNRTLDMEHLRQVYFGWGASHYNTFGYLHWGLNQYKADPFRQSVVHHPSPVASPNNFLPAGDTHVIYPGKDGPLSSVRFEAHRLGIEDYELLRQLQDVDERKHNRLVSKLFRSYTDYNTSVRKYRKVRRKLLHTLSKS